MPPHSDPNLKALAQISQRLAGLESHLNQRLDRLEQDNRQRLRLVEGGQALLQQSLDLLQSWRQQFHKRLGEIEKVLTQRSKVGMPGPLPRRRPQTGPPRHGTLVGPLVAGMAVLLATGTALFVLALARERQPVSLPPLAQSQSPPPRSASLPPSAEAPGKQSSVASPPPPVITIPELQVPPLQPEPPRVLHRVLPARRSQPALAPHQVRPGESWSTLARRHGVAVGQLRGLNRARTGRPLRAGETIRVPAPPLLANPEHLTRHLPRPRIQLAGGPRVYALLRRQPMALLPFADRPALSYGKTEP